MYRAVLSSYPRHSVMIAAQTFQMRERLLTPSLAKPRYNAEEILKTYELFVYGDIHWYSTN
jgi:hypothetical protein